MLIADAATMDEIQAIVTQIKNKRVETNSSDDSEKPAERITKLSDVVAVIKVGPGTETELEDCKLCIEDANNVTFAAIEEGVVPGGGAAYIHLSTCVHAINDKLDDVDERLGAGIIQKVGKELNNHMYISTFTEPKLSSTLLLQCLPTCCTHQCMPESISFHLEHASVSLHHRTIVQHCQLQH